MPTTESLNSPEVNLPTNLFHQPSLGEEVSALAVNPASFRNMLEVAQNQRVITSFKEGKDDNGDTIITVYREQNTGEVFRNVYSPRGIMLVAGVDRNPSVAGVPSTERLYKYTLNARKRNVVTLIEDRISTAQGAVTVASRNNEGTTYFPSITIPEELNELASGPNPLGKSKKPDVLQILNNLSAEARSVLAINTLSDNRISIGIPIIADVPAGILLEFHNAILAFYDDAWHVEAEGYSDYQATPVPVEFSPNMTAYSYDSSGDLIREVRSVNSTGNFEVELITDYHPRIISTPSGEVEIYDITQTFPLSGNEVHELDFVNFVVLRDTNAGKRSVFGASIRDEIIDPNTEERISFSFADQKAVDILKLSDASNRVLIRTITMPPMHNEKKPRTIQTRLFLEEMDWGFHINQEQSPTFTVIEND